MDTKAIKAALVPGLLALAGVRVSEMLGFKSKSSQFLAAAAGAIGGVMLASKVG